MNNVPIVTFVGICFRETNEIYMFIGMLKCMKNPNWKAIIWHDEPNSLMKSVVESFDDDRITYIENEVNSGSWGAYNRIGALQLIDTEFVVNCTIQEYYLPCFVDQIENNKKNDFIYWPCIHYGFDYNILNAAPVRQRIDWSNFAIKTHIARKVGIKYPDAYMADGLFVEDCIASGLIKKQIKIDKVLNIKN